MFSFPQSPKIPYFFSVLLRPFFFGLICPNQAKGRICLSTPFLFPESYALIFFFQIFFAARFFFFPFSSCEFAQKAAARGEYLFKNLFISSFFLLFFPRLFFFSPPNLWFGFGRVVNPWCAFAAIILFTIDYVKFLFALGGGFSFLDPLSLWLSKKKKKHFLRSSYPFEIFFYCSIAPLKQIFLFPLGNRIYFFFGPFLIQMTSKATNITTNSFFFQKFQAVFSFFNILSQTRCPAPPLLFPLSNILSVCLGNLLKPISIFFQLLRHSFFFSALFTFLGGDRGTLTPLPPNWNVFRQGKNPWNFTGEGGKASSPLPFFKIPQCLPFMLPAFRPPHFFFVIFFITFPAPKKPLRDFHLLFRPFTGGKNPPYCFLTPTNNPPLF